MAIEEVAKQDLMHCKALARANKIKTELPKSRYLVCSEGSSVPIGFFDTKIEAYEFISDSIRYDRYLYEQFEDDCLICDYWVLETELKLISYVIEREN